MVASLLQGDIACGEEGGCGLISGLESRDMPAGPDGFRRKGPNLNSGLEVRVMSQACLCAVQPVLPSINITYATMSGFVSDCNAVSGWRRRRTLIRSTVGEQRPDRSRNLVGQGDSHDVRGSPGEHVTHPLRQMFRTGDDRSGTVNQQGA